MNIIKNKKLIRKKYLQILKIITIKKIRNVY